MNGPGDLAELIADFESVKEDVAFIRALRSLRVSTDAGDAVLRFDPVSGNVTIDLRTLTPTATSPASALPSQTGNAGKILATDGATPSWT